LTDLEEGVIKGFINSHTSELAEEAPEQLPSLTKRGDEDSNAVVERLQLTTSGLRMASRWQMIW
jgi:hypothetical protein